MAVNLPIFCSTSAKVRRTRASASGAPSCHSERQITNHDPVNLSKSGTMEAKTASGIPADSSGARTTLNCAFVSADEAPHTKHGKERMWNDGRPVLKGCARARGRKPKRMARKCCILQLQQRSVPALLRTSIADAPVVIPREKTCQCYYTSCGE